MHLQKLELMSNFWGALHFYAGFFLKTNSSEFVFLDAHFPQLQDDKAMFR